MSLNDVFHKHGWMLSNVSIAGTTGHEVDGSFVFEFDNGTETFDAGYWCGTYVIPGYMLHPLNEYLVAKGISVEDAGEFVAALSELDDKLSNRLGYEATELAQTF